MNYKKRNNELKSHLAIANSIDRGEKFLDAHSHNTASANHASIKLIRGDEVERREDDWLWNNRLPLGKLTLLAGDPSVGKSLITIDIAARVTTGKTFPLDTDTRSPAKVIFLAAEDTCEDTILPRLDVAGADDSKVFFIPYVVEYTGEGELPATFSFKRHIHLLEDIFRQHSDCALLVIDPLKAYSDNIDSHQNAQVRSLLAPLVDVCSRNNVAILGVEHLTKQSNTKAMYRISGSLAYIAAARVGYVVTKDKDNPDRRIIAPVKNNLAPDQLGLAYTIETKDNVPYIQWEEQPVVIDIDEQLEHEDSDSRTQRLDAVDWLRETLKEGQVAAKDIFSLANADGHSERTLKRAKAHLGVKSIKDNNQWYWVLPQEGQNSLGKNSGTLGTLDENKQTSSTENTDKPSTGPIVPEFVSKESGTLDDIWNMCVKACEGTKLDPKILADDLSNEDFDDICGGTLALEGLKIVAKDL